MQTSTASPITNRRPGNDEYFEYYDTYIRLVPDGKCFDLLESQIEELRTYFAKVSEADASVLHPPYTWTIKQVVGHMIDAERIFADRLHRFASGEKQPQPGMDQDPYVAAHDYETPTLKSLVDELLHCRRANLLLVHRIRPVAWDVRGIASGHSVSVRALVWILVGHIMHHMTIIGKRLTH
jgi:uncharacterized damage-inducible protein DinB